MPDLPALAELIRQKNAVELQIAALVGRPALTGHVGEYIAAAVFDIELHTAATRAGSDGFFKSGTLKGRSVNIKWYGKHEGLLDISLKSPPECYLVITGPRAAPVTSRGGTRPWLIHSVFVFEADALHNMLLSRRVKLGTATSVVGALWEAAEVYPSSSNALLRLTPTQSSALALFRG